MFASPLAVAFTVAAAVLGQSAGDVAVRVFSSATGAEVKFDALVEELARRDVVFFGEEHDNAAGHRFYTQLATALQKARPDLVFGMEMFERDGQGVLDDYLRGRIDEPTFEKQCRLWPNYKRDYRPLIELAKAQKLDVVAGNVPRTVLRKLGNDGFTSPYLPRSTTAPKDRYWDEFADAMKGHPGDATKMAEGMYRAQCVKDDAMAEGISDYLDQHKHRRPFVIHCNGNFHSDYGRGTVQRFVQRTPLAQVTVLTMLSAADVAKPDFTAAKAKGHFIVVAPEPPRKAEPKAPKKEVLKTPTKNSAKKS